MGKDLALHVSAMSVDQEIIVNGHVSRQLLREFAEHPGEFDDDVVEEIWQHHPEMIKIRARRDIALNDFEFCKGCQYVKYCAGNCPGLAYTITDKVNHPSPDACLKRFLEAGGKLPDTI